MFSAFKKRNERPTYASVRRQWLGVCVTAAVVGLIVAADRYLGKVSNPASILFLTVLIVTSFSGLRAGLAGTAISFVYILLHYSVAGSYFLYTPKIGRGIIVSAVFFLVFVFLIGWIQARLRNAGIREYDARMAAEEEAQQRLRTESDLRSSEDMWQLVVDSAMDAIIVMGEDGRITLWNRNAEAMFGWRTEEAVGQRLVDLIVPPEFRDAHSAGIKRYQETGVATILGKRLELRGLSKEGNEFPIELTVVAHWRESGNLFIGFVRDMTEQSKLNERLRQAQKMEAIGTLAAGIAHDFNNILASISGNLLLAREDLPQDHPVQESHREIAKAVSRATNVVRQILTFSNPKASTSESIDMVDAVQEAIPLMRAALPGSLQIESHFVTGPTPVLADTTDIHQILLNLGINASHAMRGQNGKLEIRIERVYLDETQAESLVNMSTGACARLTIKDDGSGMDSETLKRVFDPFFTTKAPGEGTGLGLAVVYGIVERNRGAITVQSEVGKGSTFHIYFPLAKSETVPTAAEEVKVVQGNGERILYVDDDESLVYMMTRLLPRLNYAVVGMEDSRQALETFREDPSAFDLVITDMSMPHMDGPTFVKEVQAIRSTVPIVMVTGYIRDRDVEVANGLGINALILKPNTAHEMSEDVHRILSEMRPRSLG